MEYSELIIQRESCRRYLDRPVEKEKIEICLEAARLAPSACNSQPWHFTVVDDPVLVRQISAAVQGEGANRFAGEVPVFVVLSEIPVKLNDRVAARFGNEAFASVDIGIAAAHFVLAAADQGLGSCILGWFEDKLVRSALKLDSEKKPRLVFCLGYPADEKPRQKMRKSAGEIITWNE